MAALQQFPAVALLGARQVGKTTLAREVQLLLGRLALYVDLEKPSDFHKFSDPEYFLTQHMDKLVVIDEIQRQPNLMLILRGLIDERRRKGDTAGQYLLLGSSSQKLLSASSESLAGRIQYIDLSGFNVLEVGEAELTRLWLRGGFPESFLASDDIFSYRWRENLIRTYIEREAYILQSKIDLPSLQKFWMMLAHCSGELFNGSKIAASLGVTTATVFRYLRLLQDLFLVRELQPYHVNIKKRLVKTPKYYSRDSGLLHTLLGIKTIDNLLAHPSAGASFEGFVVENITSCLKSFDQLWFYRTAAGAELDLLIDTGRDLVGIEIKKSLMPIPSRGLYNAMQDLGLKHCFIVYPGQDTYKITDILTVTSLATMMQKVLAF